MASAAWGQTEEERRVEGKLREPDWVVESVARRWSGALDSHALEDLRQEARLGVWKGIITYQPGKGTKLSTYAHRCATRRVLDAMRASRHYREVEMALEDAVASANAPEAEPTQGDESAGVWTPQRLLAGLRREDLRAAYQRLDCRRQVIIAWSFGGRATVAQIAAHLQEHAEAIKKARQRAIRQIADDMRPKNPAPDPGEARGACARPTAPDAWACPAAAEAGWAVDRLDPSCVRSEDGAAPGTSEGRGLKDACGHR